MRGAESVSPNHRQQLAECCHVAGEPHFSRGTGNPDFHVKTPNLKMLTLNSKNCLKCEDRITTFVRGQNPTPQCYLFTTSALTGAVCQAVSQAGEGKPRGRDTERGRTLSPELGLPPQLHMAPWGVRAHIPIHRPESRLREGRGAAQAHTARGRRLQDQGDLPGLRGPLVPAAQGQAKSGSLTHHALASVGRAELRVG